MIHDIGVAVQARIRARGCPVTIIDGPEPTSTTTYGRERVVFEEFGGDSFEGPKSHHKNPKHAGDMLIGARIRIYAQSQRAGAFPFEHRFRARLILMQLIVALREELLLRGQPFVLGKGDYFVPPDLEATAIANGAAYELPFVYRAGIPVHTWTGEANPTGTLEGGLVNRTEMSDGSVSDDVDEDGNPIVIVETACGEEE